MSPAPVFAATESTPFKVCSLKPAARGMQGISLVELMVGMTIGLIALLVMVQTFSASEGQKGNTVSGADATTAGHVALATIERDLLSAGAGLAFVDCPAIKWYRSGANPGVVPATGVPVLIEANQNTPSALRSRSDVITVRYSTSNAGIATATINQAMPSPSSTLFADNGIGFENGDIVLISQPPKHCILLELTGTPGQTGGSRWRFNTNPSTGINPPAAGEDLYPVGGYTEGAKILSVGRPMAMQRYELAYRNTADGSVPNSDLQFVQELPTTDTRRLAGDVIALRAQYGWWNSATGTVTFSSTVDGSPTALAAVRIGLVVRASKIDRSYTAPETIRLFAGENPIDITLTAGERNYRYRTFETIVPLRNTIWNRPS